jgi:hypothetical protein
VIWLFSHEPLSSGLDATREAPYRTSKFIGGLSQELTTNRAGVWRDWG